MFRYFNKILSAVVTEARNNFPALYNRVDQTDLTNLHVGEFISIYIYYKRNKTCI